MGESRASQARQGVPTIHWTQVAIGLCVLVVGALVYVLDRSSTSVPFFSAVSLADTLPPIFGQLGQSLPTFAHVFAFSILTAAWFGGGRKTGFAAGLTWFGLDSAFEVGQHPQIADSLLRFMPGWLDSIPILNQAESYFVLGTFDVWDLISIAVGAALAYLVIHWTTHRYERFE